MSDSADKRSVHTDALATLGTIIDENTGGRDAIHLAVIPVMAKEPLMPGWDVTADGCAKDSLNEPVGIVDPFLKRKVKPGEWFWLVIYPRKITSLRHVWEHPAFPTEADLKHAEELGEKLSGRDIEKAKEWLREFAETHDVPGYDQMMATLAHSTKDPCFSTDGNADIPAEFWEHYEKATGTKVPQSQRGEWFRCAC